jgi:hypothetical protein
MDNVQHCDSYINIPSSQTYGCCSLVSELLFRHRRDCEIKGSEIVETSLAHLPSTSVLERCQTLTKYKDSSEALVDTLS